MADSPFSQNEAVRQHWPELQEDVEAIAGDYESEGWSTTQVATGDVTPLVEDSAQPAVLDVLVPGDELTRIERLAENAGFDEFDVYEQTVENDVFLVVVLKASEVESAVIYPAYYKISEAEEMLERAYVEETVWTRFRNLTDDDKVVVEQTPSSLFLPEELS